jgi:hypothetical protein
VSLEDAEGRNLTGRKVVQFMQLNDEEILRARSSMTETLDDVAANILGALPT